RAAAPKLHSRLQPAPVPGMHGVQKEAPSAKRRRVEPTMSKTTAIPESEQRHMTHALDEAAAAEGEGPYAGLANEAEETMWVRSTASEGTKRATDGSQPSALRVISVTYSDIDSEGMDSATIGRRSFGKPNRHVQEQQKGKHKASSYYSDSTPHPSDDGPAEDGNGDPSREPICESVEELEFEFPEKEEDSESK
ncbi:MAG: hypothetical protein Q9163_005963, partial [Psora crenata]